MRAVVLPAAAVLLSLGGTLAGEKPYDDRAMIRKIMVAAQSLMHLVPRAHSACERADEFKGGKLRAKLTELRAHISTVRKAMRRRGDPAEIFRHRRQMMEITGNFIAQIEAFGRNAAALASVESQLVVHMKTKPDCSPKHPKGRRWWATHKSLSVRRQRCTDLVNSGCRSYIETYNDLLRELPAIRKEVSLLYESGALKAAGAAKAGASGAPKTTDIGAVLTGSLDQLLARSACTHSEFRKALAAKDKSFLDALRGRLVIWPAMLVESAREKNGKCVARVMVRGSSYAAELPPGSKAVGLVPGAALLIAGELRKAEGQAPSKDRPAAPGVVEGKAPSKDRPAIPGVAEGQAPSKDRPAMPGAAGRGWSFRVVAWGLRAKVKAGEPMTLCKWPESGAGAEQAGPSGDASRRSPAPGNATGDN